MSGTLYLLPVPLHEGATGTMPPDTLQVLGTLRFIIAERAKTARFGIKQLLPGAQLPAITVYELDKHQPERIEKHWLEPS